MGGASQPFLPAGDRQRLFGDGGERHRVRAQPRAGGCCAAATMLWPTPGNRRWPRFSWGSRPSPRARQFSRRSQPGRPGGEPMSAPLIALTGATGFIGRHLLRDLPQRGYRVRVLLRRPAEVPPGASSAVIGDIASPHNMAAGAARRRRGHSFGRLLPMPCRDMPEDDYRDHQHAGDHRPRAAPPSAPACERFVFLSSIRAQSGCLGERRPDGGGRTGADGRLRPLEARGRAGPCRHSTSTGSRCARCSSTAPA